MTEQIAIEAPDQQLSGTEIVEDIAQRVAAALAGNCYLRATDAYSSYGTKVQIDLQLKDLDTTRVEKSFTIGQHEPGIPSRSVKVEISEATAREIRERSGTLPPSLERMVDGDAPPEKRFYAPRQKKPAA